MLFPLAFSFYLDIKILEPQMTVKLLSRGALLRADAFQWDEMLREPEPPATNAYLSGMWHYARGTQRQRVINWSSQPKPSPLTLSQWEKSVNPSSMMPARRSLA